MKDNHEILGKLNKLDMMLRRYYGHGHKGHGYAHRGQGKVLAILKERQQMSQKELAEVLDMRKQSLGELIQKLEMKEFIERMPSEEDRRIMNVRLTEKGREMADNIGKEKKEKKNIFHVLTEEEMETFIASVDKLTKELEAEGAHTGQEKQHCGHGHHGGCGKHGEHRHQAREHEASFKH